MGVYNIDGWAQQNDNCRHSKSSNDVLWHGALQRGEVETPVKCTEFRDQGLDKQMCEYYLSHLQSSGISLSNG